MVSPERSTRRPPGLCYRPWKAGRHQRERDFDEWEVDGGRVLPGGGGLTSCVGVRLCPRRLGLRRGGKRVLLATGEPNGAGLAKRLTGARRRPWTDWTTRPGRGDPPSRCGWRRATSATGVVRELWETGVDKGEYGVPCAMGLCREGRTETTARAAHAPSELCGGAVAGRRTSPGVARSSRRRPGGRPNITSASSRADSRAPGCAFWAAAGPFLRPIPKGDISELL